MYNWNLHLQDVITDLHVDFGKKVVSINMDLSRLRFFALSLAYTSPTYNLLLFNIGDFSY